MCKIERTIGLSRDRMVLMAVLLGCDFIPAGRQFNTLAILGSFFTLLTWGQHYSSKKEPQMWHKMSKLLRLCCMYPSQMTLWPVLWADIGALFRGNKSY